MTKLLAVFFEIDLRHNARCTIPEILELGFAFAFRLGACFLIVILAMHGNQWNPILGVLIGGLRMYAFN